MLKATALWSPALAYSFASAALVLSLTKGTLSAANFSPGDLAEPAPVKNGRAPKCSAPAACDER
jgi:hypothetical protein